VERHAKDLALLIEAQGGGPAILLGHSMGCQVILEYAVNVGKPSALVALFGTYGLPLDTLFDTALSRQVFRLVRRASLLGGRRGMRLLRPLVGNPLAYSISRRTGLVHRTSASRSDIYMYLEHLNHMDMRVFMRTLHQLSEHDLEADLGAIEAPTLVIAGERDLFTPLHRSARMAELIAGAELEVLPEGSHAAIVEQPELINRRIDRFLAERLGRTP
jgi:pimeloyl-ACP methyl ester carboxylesterase